MALTIVDNRIILNEGDAVTSWVASGGVTLYTSDPNPVEAGGCLGTGVSIATEFAYFPITSDDYSTGGTLSGWLQENGTMDTIVNGGSQLLVSDGTNRIGYHVGGSDATGFRHETGPVKWACYVLDLANKPTNFTAHAGTEASLNTATITEVGNAFKTLSKALGGGDNCYWDIIRFADNGVGLEVYGGTVTTAETISTLALTDRSTGTLQGLGVIRETATGVYGVQGNINLGDNTSTNDTYIDIIGDVIAFENRGLSADNYYRFNIAGNGTGVTVIDIQNATFTVSEGASGSFSSNDANVTCTVASTVFAGLDQGVSIGGSAVDWDQCTFNLCGVVTLSSTSTLTDSTILNGVGTASVNTATLADVTGCDFTSDGSNHAIELTSIGGGSMNWDNTLTGYVAGASGSPAATGATGNEAIYVNVSVGTLTINVVAGANIPSIRTAGAIVNVVAGQVTTLITVSDISDNTFIQNARVLVEAFSGGTGNYRDSVTITRIGTVATVAHTSHGVVTGNKVNIIGPDDSDYTGVKTVTATTVNEYTYEVTGSPISPAAGTITSTDVYISAITDIDGEVSDTRSFGGNQPVKGRVRRATTGTLYATGVFSATISSANGLSLGVQLISDE